MSENKKNMHKLKKDNKKANESTQKNECMKDIENLKAQLLRVNSDFQNFKRRAEKEKTEWFDIAQGSVIKSFLPILDDFERAFDSFEKIDGKEDNKAWAQGFELVFDKFKKTLKDLGVKEIAETKQFDPLYHEALMQVDSKDHTSGEIVQILTKGYSFKDKVIRHAKVSVAK